MTQPAFTPEQVQFLQQVADPLNKILNLQRLQTRDAGDDQLGLDADTHSTQSNHCSSASTGGCHIWWPTSPATDDTVLTS